MQERRDWSELKPVVEIAIRDAFEKYIPKIVEQCQQHDKIMILRHEVASSNKRHFVVWGIFISLFNAGLSAILWQFKH